MLPHPSDVSLSNGDEPWVAYKTPNHAANIYNIFDPIRERLHKGSDVEYHAGNHNAPFATDLVRQRTGEQATEETSGLQERNNVGVESVVGGL